VPRWPSFAAFRWAWAGICAAVRAERNMGIHLVIASIALAPFVFVPWPEAAFWRVVTAVALVLAFELANTAVERAVDLATTRRHPLAKAAKDAAAGAVLVVAGYAAVCGFLIFGPPVWQWMTQGVWPYRDGHVLVSACAAMALAALWSALAVVDGRILWGAGLVAVLGGPWVAAGLLVLVGFWTWQRKGLRALVPVMFGGALGILLGIGVGARL